MALPSRYSLNSIPERGIAMLRVTGDLNMQQRKEFVFNLEQLLACPEKKLVVDLTRIERLFSIYLGTLVDVKQRAEKDGKVFSILATKKVAQLFSQANLDVHVPLVVV